MRPQYEYFGVLEQHGNFGRVRVLARFDEGGRLARGFVWHADPIGPTGKVFLPISLDALHLPPGPVFLNAETNPKGRRAGHRDDDQLIVIKRDRFEIEHAADVCQVIEVDWEPGGTEPVPRQDLREGAIVYVRRSGDKLWGPWRATSPRELRPLRGKPYNEKRVLGFSLGALGDVWVGDRNEGHVDGYLLRKLDPSLGEAIDLASPEQVIKWFLESAKNIQDLAPCLAEIDRRAKGWRKQLREWAKEHEDAFDRAIFEQRCSRLEELLGEVVSFDAQLRGLDCLAVFADVREAFIEAKRVELEIGANERAKSELERLERRRQGLEIAVSELENRREQELAMHESRRLEVRALTEHLESEIGRLRKDITLLTMLGVRPPGHEAIRGASEWRKLVAAEGAMPWGGADCDGVRLRRLADAAGLRGLPTGEKLFLAAFEGSRLVLAPDLAWASAWAEASGAWLLSMQVRPSWVSFEGAWRDGLAAAWDCADDNPNHGVVIHVQDIDRSAAECYLRPALDLAVGRRMRIDGGRAWPANLTLVASPSRDSLHLPMSQWLVLHFSAVEPLVAQPGTEAGSRTRKPDAGESKVAVPAPVSDLTSLVDRERSRIAALLRVLRSNQGAVEHDGDAESRDLELATKIRVDWPLAYATGGSGEGEH